MRAPDFKAMRCRVIDEDEARTTTHREVLLIMAQTFDVAGAVILCEPSVVGARSGAPDIAVVDPESGVHVIEVKGVTIDQVRSMWPGGAIEITYDGRAEKRDPFKQARNAMFDIKDAAGRHFGGDLNGGFEAWVAFPRIRRASWEEKFGLELSARPDVLFQDDLLCALLGDRMRASGRQRLRGIGPLPQLQLRSLMAAFGDSAVLAPPVRPGTTAPEGSLGERLADGLSEHRVLTEQQQRLAGQRWNDGPRLVRGVAGSGKTVVLATQIARLVEGIDGETDALFGEGTAALPILAVCFNRTLVPFIRDRIEAAYRQRTGDALPEGHVEVVHFNRLMWQLSQRGLLHYQQVKQGEDPGPRARRYLADLEKAAERLGDGLYRAIFVDEGQDFHEDEYRVLLRLCERTTEGLPRMFVFYDDAQNLYGATRPTWSDLGLEVRGRSVVMDESYRSTRQIIEPAFNVLVGSYAPQQVRMRRFADLATLREKHLVTVRGEHIIVRFARREGDPARLLRSADTAAEDAAIADRAAHLLRDEGLCPHDLMVLTARRDRAGAIAKALSGRVGDACVRCAFEEEAKDAAAVEVGRITVSTIASAKGYDAPYVILASAHDCGDGTEGRATFYVGCTRARDWLDVSACEERPTIREFSRALGAMA